MDDQKTFLIVDTDGNEYEFPEGMDPKLAAQRVTQLIKNEGLKAANAKPLKEPTTPEEGQSKGWKDYFSNLGMTMMETMAHPGLSHVPPSGDSPAGPPIFQIKPWKEGAGDFLSLLLPDITGPMSPSRLPVKEPLLNRPVGHTMNAVGRVLQGVGEATMPSSIPAAVVDAAVRGKPFEAMAIGAAPKTAQVTGKLLQKGGANLLENAGTKRLIDRFMPSQSAGSHVPVETGPVPEYPAAQVDKFPMESAPVPPAPAASAGPLDSRITGISPSATPKGNGAIPASSLSNTRMSDLLNKFGGQAEPSSDLRGVPFGGNAPGPTPTPPAGATAAHILNESPPTEPLFEKYGISQSAGEHVPVESDISPFTTPEILLDRFMPNEGGPATPGVPTAIPPMESGAFGDMPSQPDYVPRRGEHIGDVSVVPDMMAHPEIPPVEGGDAHSLEQTLLESQIPPEVDRAQLPKGRPGSEELPLEGAEGQGGLEGQGGDTGITRPSGPTVNESPTEALITELRKRLGHKDTAAALEIPQKEVLDKAPRTGPAELPPVAKDRIRQAFEALMTDEERQAFPGQQSNPLAKDYAQRLLGESGTSTPPKTAKEALQKAESKSKRTPRKQ